MGHPVALLDGPKGLHRGLAFLDVPVNTNYLHIHGCNGVTGFVILSLKRGYFMRFPSQAAVQLGNDPDSVGSQIFPLPGLEAIQKPSTNEKNDQLDLAFFSSIVTLHVLSPEPMHCLKIFLRPMVHADSARMADQARHAAGNAVPDH